MSDLLPPAQVERAIALLLDGRSLEEIGEELSTTEDHIARVLASGPVLRKFLERKKNRVALAYYGPIADRLTDIAANGAKREAVQAASLLDRMFDLGGIAEEPEQEEAVEEEEPEEITLEEALEAQNDA